MNGGKVLDQIEIDLRNYDTGDIHTIYLNVFENSLSYKWLKELNNLIKNNFHLEKNYCFVGFPYSKRNGWYICERINEAINHINNSSINYYIDDYYDMENSFTSMTPQFEGDLDYDIDSHKFNLLHHYFEELQGVSGKISPFYNSADAKTKWYIRQLNLLCHEFETWAKSYRKTFQAPMWVRPSQLMCWLNAPRFKLEESDYEFFGIETLNRDMGAVYVGVNKAVGKDHWEVFCDEDGSDIDDLTTSTLKPQTEAAGDFDIEWAVNPKDHEFQQTQLKEFQNWLIRNNFDPEDKSLTIGHPQVGQVDLEKSFPDSSRDGIWNFLNNFLDVYSIRTSDASIKYDYHWSDKNYAEQQIQILKDGLK